MCPSEYYHVFLDTINLTNLWIGGVPVVKKLSILYLILKFTNYHPLLYVYKIGQVGI